LPVRVIIWSKRGQFGGRVRAALARCDAWGSHPLYSRRRGRTGLEVGRRYPDGMERAAEQRPLLSRGLLGARLGRRVHRARWATVEEGVKRAVSHQLSAFSRQLTAFSS